MPILRIPPQVEATTTGAAMATRPARRHQSRWDRKRATRPEPPSRTRPPGAVKGRSSRTFARPARNSARRSYLIGPGAPDARDVSLVELRSGKIVKTIDVYGAPFDPPAWR